MRFAWVLFTLAGSGVGVGRVHHPVAVVAAISPATTANHKKTNSAADGI